ncbi:hypothetical protein DRH27_02070 [Candidatus Falkowbacteria bacterium]|nr:MAG: hypothetical protein DRH27_02070 [Candidatus Falkowbacteria bacterium]
MSDTPINKMSILAPALAAVLAGAVGWVIGINARVSANEVTIVNWQTRAEVQRIRFEKDIDVLRTRIATMEQSVSRVDERTIIIHPE